MVRNNTLDHIENLYFTLHSLGPRRRRDARTAWNKFIKTLALCFEDFPWETPLSGLSCQREWREPKSVLLNLISPSPALTILLLEKSSSLSFSIALACRWPSSHAAPLTFITEIARWMWSIRRIVAQWALLSPLPLDFSDKIRIGSGGCGFAFNRNENIRTAEELHAKRGCSDWITDQPSVCSFDGTVGR